MSSDYAVPEKFPIVLFDYDGAWRKSFEHERVRIMGTLGVPFGELEHFGSTAIPSLVAKPVIDMMAPFASLSDAKRHSPNIQELGYAPVETDFSNRLLFKRDDVLDEEAFHLHLVVCHSWPIKNELLFRDWLIDHADAAAEYATLKRRLADVCKCDMRRYTMGKTEFVRRIVCKARIVAGLPAETEWKE